MKISIVYLPALALLLISCSASKRLTVKENTSVKRSDNTHAKETITEPFTSFIELPLESSDQPMSMKRYELINGKTKIKAEVQGKTLKLTASNDKQVCEDKTIEKVVTKDKLIYKDKLVKAAYIPKWVYILIALNVVFVGWKLKRFFTLLEGRLCPTKLIV